MTPEEFAAHVAALASAVPGGTATAADVLAGRDAGRLLLTFDDGGASAFGPIADLLETRGWRGHVFVTTDYLGAPGFLDAAQLRELHRRGHVIGSHSCSHPKRMSACSRAQLRDEWRRSCAVLADVLGEAVTAASVPGGYHSRAVAETAAEAGVRVLFTSEPTTRAHTVGGCLVLGRYTVYRGMAAGSAAALAAGRRLARWRQALWWKVKKVAKAVGGQAYLSLREKVLARRYGAGEPTEARARRA